MPSNHTQGQSPPRTPQGVLYSSNPLSLLGSQAPKLPHPTLAVPEHGTSKYGYIS